ncbi:hypothetical protein DUZ99_17175 [Xylanibacillus composti]|uniref:Uncharacterized protein n=1 Tax=Xylanibacillus composti TaxID=1572762 RepID=A0A8J4H4H5_9BACL|nr:sulfite exporter TauE/SafE family protein [Xylanibacillus composti]MDT9726711.1 hypothetical protein [Xylanibacillus composti]GIQ69357.1 hypothetical protein XYCOK13_21810 [Xylanibacillus composti]
MENAYSYQRRLIWALVSVAAGILIAGFWNYHLVDGFGRNIVSGKTIGDSAELAQSFSMNGYGFGMLFAAVAGLAATFTACNCVVFSMIPSLTCSNGQSPVKTALRSLLVFSAAVLLISAVYGFIVGLLGKAYVEQLNVREVRLLQAQITFSLLGIAMLVWAALSFGFLNRMVRRLPERLVLFFSSTSAKAGILGVFVGLFSVGRPFPVFRDFLTYAVASNNPLYTAFVMCLQGLGQIAVMVVLMVLLAYLFRRKIISWMETRPHQPQLVSAIALAAGGAYFLYYWGIGRLFDIGSWGFKLGWY